ncbi:MULTISPECIES: hypothetical protein [Nocardioides]|uniref:Uncharacterized protein n=1 Tax=Nocardioides vastitatis TaxID=2568655 RepID=A0ABW0ZFR3_9ACTN|nr:hypothetical protein [Nocardioides sp.]THI95464.1 hypothetical protein E7Z54_19150 [Nocardioides sp.]
MTEPKQPHAERPVLNGLVALLAVGLGVGLILALVALAGANLLGLDSDSGASSAADATVRDSMYIPSEFESTGDSGPLITLATEETEEPTATATATEAETTATTEPPKPGRISLQAEQGSVAAGERIYFAGIYPDGEGAILWVQRFENGAWADFPASVGVSNGTFRSYIFTEISGLNRFRVIDRDTGKASNEIRVRVG